MSTEAPRNSGTGEPIRPQRPSSGFSGLLKRFVGISPAQIPPGLEDFTGRIQQVVGDHFATVRQQELERRNTEIVKVAAETEERARDVQRQREFAVQEIARKARDTREASQVLRDFQIEDRFNIIQQTVWEGKGKIRSIDPYLSLGTGGYELGGFELVHQYPSYTTETVGDLCHGRWRYVSHTDSTRLIVAVRGKFLTIKSFETESLKHVAIEAIIPIDAEDSNNLLATALTKETVDRIANQGLPSQLERRAKEKRSQLPHWQRWISYYNSNYDPSGPD